MLGIFTRRCREINIYCRGIAQQALSGFGCGAFDRVVVKNDLLQVEGCQHIISMFKANKAVSLSNVKKLSVCWALVSTLQVPGSSDRQFLLTLF